MNDIIQTLRDFEVLRDDDNVQHKVVEGIEPDMVPMSSIPKLDGALADRLAAMGVQELYKHQSEAINHAMAGKNVVLEAPTASGKTLSFAIPVLQSLVKSQKGHALFIYPMKAVAADQRKQLSALHEGLKQIGGKPIVSRTYDGDETTQQKREMREDPPCILMTNIEYIHQSFLGNHKLWKEFLKNLRWIIVDEMHEYRGYFGTNAAMVLRRLVHHLTVNAGFAQFFLATATSKNPLEHAENLTGQSFELVHSSRGLRPKRNYVFVDPKIEGPRFWQILKLRAALVACALDDLNKSAIIFCPTREFAESAYQIAIERFMERGRDKDSVRVYKSGMRADERESIMRDLKSGAAKFVFSTNALELGIDIAGLDAVVMVGFPDSLMSARQQIGRAGRDWRSEGTVIYLARNSSRDQFYAQRLDEFLSMPLAELVTDLGNKTIAADHGDCVWFESGPPDMGRSLDYLGEGIVSRIEEIYAGDGRPEGYGFGNFTPHHDMNIRGSSESSFELDHDGENVGTISSYQKYKEAYFRAIYLHGGLRYRVKGMLTEKDRKVVLLESEPKNHATEVKSIRSVNVQNVFGQQQYKDGLTVLSCDVWVNEYMNQVREVSLATGEFVDRWSLDGSDTSFGRPGHAAAWKVELDDIEAPAIAALEHLLRIGVGFVIPVDVHDVFTVSVPKDNEIYAIESCPGGIGVAARIFERWREVLRQGADIAEKCRCTEAKGCAYCIVPPRYHDEMNKADGLALAHRLLDLADPD